jgi:hypothetical protein
MDFNPLTLYKNSHKISFYSFYLYLQPQFTISRHDYNSNTRRRFSLNKLINSGYRGEFSKKRMDYRSQHIRRQPNERSRTKRIIGTNENTLLNSQKTTRLLCFVSRKRTIIFRHVNGITYVAK